MSNFMKRCLTMCVVLVLVGCVTALPLREFNSDQQNVDKFNELALKFKKEHGCDKLSKLYDFTKIKTPTVNDLSEIMPIFDLKADDASNVDKVYNIDFSVINKYNCDDAGNTNQLINELVQYCDDKYSNTPNKKSDCEYYLKQSLFVVDKNHGLTRNVLDRRQTIQRVKDKLEQGIMNNIQKIYPLPNNTEKFLPVFSASELIKARKEVLGTYDDNCEIWLCEEELRADRTVTRLNAIRMLYSVCRYSFRYLGEHPECVCYANETYKKVDYKNLIYIHEKEGMLPQSKTREFDI